MPLKSFTKLSHKGLLLIGVPLIIEIVLLLTLVFLIIASDKQSQQLDKYKNVIARVEETHKLIYDGVHALFLFGMTKSPEVMQRYDGAVTEVKKTLKELRVMVGENPKQRHALSRVSKLIEEQVEFLNNIRETLKTESGLVLFKDELFMPRELAQAAKLTKALDDFVQLVKTSESATPRKAERLQFLVKLCLCLAIATGAVSSAISVIFFHNITKRLGTLNENTVRMAGNQTLLPLVSGSDEIANLDSEFHRMARALSEATAWKQQIIALVSHELRTPLNSIEAYLMLLKMAYTASSARLVSSVLP